MNSLDTYSETTYGFKWGAALVQRMTSLTDRKGVVNRVVIGITTDSGKHIDVYVSGSGRSLRVFSDGKEWKP